MNRTPFWLSWWSAGSFTYEGPWWISGYRFPAAGGEQASICAAVMARDADEAKAIIRATHDAKDIEWRFAEPRDAAWSPFCDRFPRARWMRWPWPALRDTPEGKALRRFRRAMHRYERRAKRAGILAPQLWCRAVRLDAGEAEHIDFAERARSCRESDGGTRAFLYERAAEAVAKLYAALAGEAPR